MFFSASPFITVNLPSSSAKKFRKVVGKETCSETLESTPTLEKAKFPQDYFPEVGFVINTHDWLTAFPSRCRLTDVLFTVEGYVWSKFVFLDVLNPTYCYVLCIHQFVAFFMHIQYRPEYLYIWFAYILWSFYCFLFLQSDFSPYFRETQFPDLKTNQHKEFKEKKSLLCFPCPVEQFPAHAACVQFSGFDVWCAVRRELGAEHICADIVIKSTTARVSSPHSPLICQPCSGGRLRKYMQNRWIRPPSHTSPQFPSLSHTAGPPPPFNPPTYLPTLSHPRHTHIHT